MTVTNFHSQFQIHNFMEIMMEHVAEGLGMDPLEVKRKNFFKKGDQLVTGFHSWLARFFINFSPRKLDAHIFRLDDLFLVKINEVVSDLLLDNLAELFDAKRPDRLEFFFSNARASD